MASDFLPSVSSLKWSWTPDSSSDAEFRSGNLTLMTASGLQMMGEMGVAAVMVGVASVMVGVASVMVGVAFETS